MNQKSIEHIALLFPCIGRYSCCWRFSPAVLFYPKVLTISVVVLRFFATVIVLMAIYASLQITFNQFLQPRIEAFSIAYLCLSNNEKS